MLIQLILSEFRVCSVTPVGLVIAGSIDSDLTLSREARDREVSTVAMGSLDQSNRSEVNEVLVAKRAYRGQVARFATVSDESTEHRTARRTRIEKQGVPDPVEVNALIVAIGLPDHRVRLGNEMTSGMLNAMENG